MTFILSSLCANDSLCSIAVYNLDGHRIARSTGVDILLQSNFDLVVNDYKYRVEVPDESKCTIDHFRSHTPRFIILIELYIS